MLVEFVGPSGAGKTTLIERTRSALASHGRAVEASPIAIAGLTGTTWARNDVARNVLLDFALMPHAKRLARAHPEYQQFCEQHLRRAAVSTFDRVSRARAFVRQRGSHALLRSAHVPSSIVLVDEGILSTVQSALVGVRAPPEAAAVDLFAKLVPRPDFVVHVDTPVEICLERTLRRPDPPLRGKLRAYYREFITNTSLTYRELGTRFDPDIPWVATRDAVNDADRVAEAIRALPVPEVRA